MPSAPAASSCHLLLHAQPLLKGFTSLLDFVLQHMPPEVLVEGVISKAVDVYSLGVLVSDA